MDDRRWPSPELSPSGGNARRAYAGVVLRSLLAAALTTVLSSAAAFVLFGADQLPDVVMTYLLGIMLISSRHGFGPSVFAALLSVTAFNFLFVPPYFTLAVADFQHTVTFAVMFLVAIVISGLTQRLRSQAQAARRREEWTLALYELSRALAGVRGKQRVIEVSAAQFEQVFESQLVLFVPGPGRTLVCAYRSAGLGAPSDSEASIAEWVWSNERDAERETLTPALRRALYLPVLVSARILGVIGIVPEQAGHFSSSEERRRLDAFVAQLALALERVELAEHADAARRAIEVEQLRSALLSSVSHDLRTPLAVITGAASALVESGPWLPDASRQELTKTIFEEAERLNRLIRNLLDMTRLEAGSVTVKKEWIPLEEVVGSALTRLDARLAGRDVHVELRPDLPLVPFDAVLIEQVLINLLENAAKYADGAIDIDAEVGPGAVTVEIADRGPGVPREEETRIFEKFHRAEHAGRSAGVGLGLAICRAIVTAHGGRIWVENRETGGASFRFSLPIHGEAPATAADEPRDANAGEALP